MILPPSGVVESFLAPVPLDLLTGPEVREARVAAHHDDLHTPERSGALAGGAGAVLLTL